MQPASEASKSPLFGLAPRTSNAVLTGAKTPHCHLSTCKHAFIVPGCNRVAWDQNAGFPRAICGNCETLSRVT